MICKGCGNKIPQGRIDLGYSVCVECSDVKRYGCVDVVEHKTGNTIQVLPREDAEQANKLTQRTGFGTLRSLRSGKTQKDKKSFGKCCSNAFVGNEKSFEQVGQQCMLWVELEEWEKIPKTLQKAVDTLMISKNQWNRLTRIFKEFIPKEEEIKEKVVEEVGEEIHHAFRNWKNSKIYR